MLYDEVRYKEINTLSVLNFYYKHYVLCPFTLRLIEELMVREVLLGSWITNFYST